MALDKEPIVDDMDGYRMNIDKSSKIIEKKRNGFHDDLVRKLSRALTVVGILSIVLGIFIEIFAALITCEIYCYGVHFSSIGAGIWCGTMFIGVGTFGCYAAKKKSTCWIVAIMAIGVSASVFAAAQIGLSVAALAADRNKFKAYYNVTERGEVHRREYPVKTIPVTVFGLNLIQAVLGLVAFVLHITSSVVCSVATCCLSKPNYLRINLFEAVSSSDRMYSQLLQVAPQPYAMPGGQMYYVPQGYGSGAQGAMQPMIMIPANSQPPHQYQMMGQRDQDVPTPSLTNTQPADQGPGQDSVQQV